MKIFFKLWAFLVAVAALLMTLQDFYDANEVVPKTEVHRVE